MLLLPRSRVTGPLAAGSRACLRATATDPHRRRRGWGAPVALPLPSQVTGGILLCRDDTLRNALLRHGAQIALLAAHNDYSGTVSAVQAERRWLARS